MNTVSIIIEDTDIQNSNKIGILEASIQGTSKRCGQLLVLH